MNPINIRKNITCIDIPVKECILSVTYHGCPTSDSDTILQGRITNHREGQKTSLG